MTSHNSSSVESSPNQFKGINDIKLSVVIPCYNEKDFIREIIARVKASPVPNMEIIIVDDGSTDGTREILKSEIESEVDRVIYHDRNLGKGGGLRSGFKAATGDIVVIQDADLEYDPNDYILLLEPFIKNKADVVYGSRFVGRQAHRVIYFWHMIGNKFLTFFSNMLTNLNLTDMETCYKVFRKEILDRIEIEENGFAVDPELTAKVAKMNCPIYEVGVSYSGRTYAQGKKIGWKDGIRHIITIVKYNIFR